jgi:hypothetical protein
MTHLPRRAFLLLVALLLGFAPAVGLLPLVPSQVADAFNPPVHIAIFDEALGDKFSPEAQAWVKLGLEYSDRPLGHFYPQLHFDSAQDRWQVCQRLKEGPRFLLSRSAEAALQAPNNPSPGFRTTALTLYGQYIHAIMDFYSHANWIELHVAKGEKPETLPILTQQGECNPLKLPEKLTTGYFSPWYGFDGCPDAGPPGGFEYCHGPTADPTQQLAKDVPDGYHGADLLPGGSAICPENPCTRSYHDEAKRLATDATRESWPAFKATIEAAMQDAFPDRDAACLFTWLVQGGDPACAKQVGLGTFFHGEVAAVDDSALVLWEDPSGGIIDPEFYTSLRDVRVEIHLDTTADGTFVTGGSLYFQLTHKATGDLVVYEASQAHGSIAPVADGYDGFVEFTGTRTESRPGEEPSVDSGLRHSFELAIDGSGQPVLCQSLPLPTLDGVRQYHDCLTRAVVRLQPAQAVPPSA